MSKKIMNVIEITKPGGPEVLKLTTREIPSVGEDEVLIKVAAAGVNGPDVAQRKGLYPPPPGASDLPGLEVSGEVVEVGTKAKKWKKGDSVCALTNGGGYAEYVNVNEGHCLPIPDGVSVTDAAGIPETFFTVWSNLFLGQKPKEGSNILVHGGSGGIGATTIQVANALGYNVMATCREDNQKFCEELGAKITIDYKNQDFLEVVKNEGGADVIVDIIGGDYVNKNIKASNPDAKIIQLAFNKGAEVTVNLMPLMLKRLTITGSTLRPRPIEFKTKVAEEITEVVLPLFEAKKIKTVTYKTFGLKDAEDAHREIEKGGHKGKILLVAQQ